MCAFENSTSVRNIVRSTFSFRIAQRSISTFSNNHFLVSLCLSSLLFHCSYSYTVAAALKGRCLVQLSPFSRAGCALDSSYGLQCLPLFLSTTNLSPTRYDVISFNFGMHDVDYSGHFPEVKTVVRIFPCFISAGSLLFGNFCSWVYYVSPTIIRD